MKSDKRIFENVFTSESIEFELIILNSRRNYQDSIITVGRYSFFKIWKFETVSIKLIRETVYIFKRVEYSYN